jgi:hypothetical protein
MDRAIALMGLGGIMRQAIRMIRGIQIKQDQQAFEMAVFSVFAWFKVGRRACSVVVAGGQAQHSCCCCCCWS